MTTEYDIKDIVNTALERQENEECKELIRFLPDFVELLSVQFCKDVLSAHQRGEKSIVFVNIWRVSWKFIDGEFQQFKATFSATSGTRKLTQRFLENNNVVDKSVEDYFQQILSRPPRHLELLQNLSDRAQENHKVYPKQLKIGKNSALLFRMLFSTLLYLTYEKQGVVKLSGIGTFERKFKIKKKVESAETAGGILQMTPDPHNF